MEKGKRNKEIGNSSIFISFTYNEIADVLIATIQRFQTISRKCSVSIKQEQKNECPMCPSKEVNDIPIKRVKQHHTIQFVKSQIEYFQGPLRVFLSSHKMDVNKVYL